ncbi:hypothetical protein AYO38_03030 [bacterium SCGC AG-212-C10]|nr:hypothetical protein AYO38_03030 [bacterium SCGC AG-212-C10]
MGHRDQGFERGTWFDSHSTTVTRNAMNSAINSSALMTETRLRIERAERRASLRSSLGALPVHETWQPFRRRAVPLLSAVEIEHAASTNANRELPNAA